MTHHDPGGEHDRAFATGVALNVAFTIIEAVAGIVSGSLALLADAGHNLGDVLGLLLAWGASRLVQRQPTVRRTYGLRRSSILAAALNACLLLVTVGVIAWEAVDRLFEPTPVAGTTMILVAGIGVVINGVTALLFRTGRQRDLNIHGAYLHMMVDAAVSLGVVVAGTIIQLTGRVWVDPATSLIIGVVITAGTWDLLRRSIDLTLDAVPDDIDPAAVRGFLAGLPEVLEVHDLHIWAMSTTETALTAHVVCPGTRLHDDWLADVAGQLHDRFHIEHATIQVETGSRACRQAPEHVV